MTTIVQSPNPLLNEVCKPCDLSEKSLKELKKLAKQMAKAMYKYDGCGLAAPQVGVLQRLVVMDCEVDDYQKNTLVLVNPQLIETKGKPVIDKEGCLSCPGISVPIARAPWARVRYFDLDGEEWELEGDGLLGRCMQHEIDHLNGITMFERATPKDRMEALRAYEQARVMGARPGDVGSDDEEAEDKSQSKTAQADKVRS